MLVHVLQVIKLGMGPAFPLPIAPLTARARPLTVIVQSLAAGHVVVSQGSRLVLPAAHVCWQPTVAAAASVV